MSADQAGHVPGDAEETSYKDSHDYIQFKEHPIEGQLNRWSHTITREHDFPGAQVRKTFSESSTAVSCVTAKLGNAGLWPVMRGVTAGLLRKHTGR